MTESLRLLVTQIEELQTCNKEWIEQVSVEICAGMKPFVSIILSNFYLQLFDKIDRNKFKVFAQPYEKKSYNKIGSVEREQKIAVSITEIEDEKI